MKRELVGKLDGLRFSGDEDSAELDKTGVSMAKNQAEGDARLRQRIGAVRRLLEQRGMSEAALCEPLGISPAGVSQFLNEKMKSKKTINRHIRACCAFLQIATDDLDLDEILRRHHGLVSAKYCIRLGNSQTLWYRRTGNGITPIEPTDISIQYDGTSEVRYPTEIERLWLRVRSEHARGLHKFANNPSLVVIDGLTWPPADITERPQVRLIVGKTDYALRFALRNTSEGRRLAKQYITTWTPNAETDPITSQGLGTSVAIVSQDKKLIMGRRADVLGVRAGQLDVGAVEGFSVARDVGPDYQTVRTRQLRVDDVTYSALWEEYGIGRDDVSRIEILNFGFDLQYSQWNFVALAYVNRTADEIQWLHRTIAPQGQEYSETFAVDAEPSKVMRFLSDDVAPVWSCGLATAFYALARLFGPKAADSAVSGLSFRMAQTFIHD